MESIQAAYTTTEEEASISSPENVRRSTHISTEQDISKNNLNSTTANVPTNNGQTMELMPIATTDSTEQEEPLLLSKNVRRSTHIVLHSLLEDNSASECLPETHEPFSKHESLPCLSNRRSTSNILDRVNSSDEQEPVMISETRLECNSYPRGRFAEEHQKPQKQFCRVEYDHGRIAHSANDNFAYYSMRKDYTDNNNFHRYSYKRDYADDDASDYRLFKRDYVNDDTSDYRLFRRDYVDDDTSHYRLFRRDYVDDDTSDYRFYRRDYVDNDYRLSSHEIQRDRVTQGRFGSRREICEIRERSRVVIKPPIVRKPKRDLPEPVIPPEIAGDNFTPSDLCEPYSCKLCKVSFDNQTMATSHYKGKNHKKAVTAYAKEVVARQQSGASSSTKKAKLNPENNEEVCSSTKKAKLNPENNEEVCSSTKKAKLNPENNEVCGSTKNAELNSENNEQCLNPENNEEICGSTKSTKLNSENNEQDVAEPENLQADTSLPTFSCGLCGVSTRSQDNFNLHLMGKKHKLKEQMQKNEEKSKERTFAEAEDDIKEAIPSNIWSDADVSVVKDQDGKYEYTCNLCDVVTKQLPIIQAHLHGSKHRNKRLKRKEHEILVSGAFKCTLCDITTDSREDLNIHLAGHKHKHKLEEKFELPHKRKRSSDNLVNYYAETTAALATANDGIPLSNFMCTVCNVQTTSQGCLNAHLQGQKHKERVEKYGEAAALLDHPSSVWQMKYLQAAKSTADMTSMGDFTCTICNVKTTCQQNLDMHLRGQKHKDALENKKKMEAQAAPPGSASSDIQMTVDENVSQLKMPAFSCTLCSITTSSQGNLDSHLQGQKHMQKLANKRRMGAAEVDPTQASSAKSDVQMAEAENFTRNRMPAFYCALCNVIASSQGDLIMHIQGQKHKQKMISAIATLKSRNDYTNPETRLQEVTSEETEQQVPLPDVREDAASRAAKIFGSDLTVVSDLDSGLHPPVLPAASTTYTGTSKSEKATTSPLQQTTSSLTSPFFCELCKVKASCQKSFDRHLKGMKHRENRKIERLTESKHVCPLCNITTSSEVDLEHHFRGRKHKEKLGIVDMKKPSGEAGNSALAFKCDLCNIAATCQQNLDNHMLGKQHRENAEKAGVTRLINPVSSSFVPPTSPDDSTKNSKFRGMVPAYVCTMCNMWVKSKEELNVHYNSPKHKETALKQGSQSDVIVQEPETSMAESNISSDTNKFTNGMSMSPYHHAPSIKSHRVSSNFSSTSTTEKSRVPASSLLTHKQPGATDAPVAVSTSFANTQSTAMELQQPSQQNLSMDSFGTEEKTKTIKAAEENVQSTIIPNSFKTNKHVSIATLPDGTCEFRCNVCFTITKRVYSMQVHLEGSCHIKRVKALAGDFSTLAPSAFHCSMCGVYTGNQSELDAHLNGKKHKEMVQRVEAFKSSASADVQQPTPQNLSKNSVNNENRTTAVKAAEEKIQPEVPTPEVIPDHFKTNEHMTLEKLLDGTNEFRCNLCFVITKSLTRMQAHLEGIGHCKKVAALAGDFATSDFHCSMCGIYTGNQLELNAHFNGKKHKEMVQRVEAFRAHVGKSLT